ncbi:MAG: alanine racemase [Candidatus Omnitrophica bacterium]|nr:alanine racemase [Candidatus Omnitrophota bacterium]
MRVFKEQQSAIYQPLSYVSIDLAAIRHNFLALQKLASQQMVAGAGRQLDLIPVIKADAYGHGMIQAAQIISECGAKFFAVSNLQEGVRLREAGFKQKILVFETTLPELAPALVENDLIPSVCTLEMAKTMDQCAFDASRRVNVHLKVDTAMGRLGVPLEQSLAFIKKVRQLRSLHWEGIFTHFPSADTDEDLTLTQIKSFMELIQGCERMGMRFEHVHAANSMGLMGYKNIFFNLARPGLMLYGLYPHPDVREKIFLKPAMSVVSKIIFIKKILKGQGISYGQSFVAERDMMIAVLPIGYNDGYSRALSNKACVLIEGVRAPVVGRVTMDQVMVDISHLPLAQIGMPAVILGKADNGEVISADDLAGWAGTISYEIVCNLGNRMPRVYLS